MPPHILIIEDEDDIREALQDFLESEGFPVTTAIHGKHAFEILESQKKPDVILLDLMMPVLSGAEFIERQKKNVQLKDIPIILMSADNHTDTKAETLGVQGFVKKPLDLDHLISVVKACCAS